MGGLRLVSKNSFCFVCERILSISVIAKNVHTKPFCYPFIERTNGNWSSHLKHIYFCRSITTSSYNEMWEDQVKRVLEKYENLLGITQIKQMQTKVIQAEAKFSAAQGKRREIQEDILKVQSKLKDVRLELDKTSRVQDRYLQLITQEHALIKEENALLETFHLCEKDEREYFSALSIAVRNNQDQERAHAEKTKYWSIIGSVCGALIGFLGSSINNSLRMKELRDLVSNTTNPDNLQDQVKTFSEIIQQQKQESGNFASDLKSIRILVKNISDFISAPNQSFLATFNNLETQAGEILSLVKAQDSLLSDTVRDVQSFLTGEKLLENGNVSNFLSDIYAEQLFKQVENNLENMKKTNIISTAALIYSTVVLTTVFIMYTFNRL